MQSLNVVVDNGYVCDGDRDALFPDGEEVLVVSPLTDIWRLLLMLGAFPSRSQARKNWTGSTTVPDGWSEFCVGKRRRFLYIWNPTE